MLYSELSVLEQNATLLEGALHASARSVHKRISPHK